MKKIVSVLLSLVLIVALAACGGASLAGKYILVSMENNGEDQMPRLTAAGVSPDEIYIAFQGGNAVKIALMIGSVVETEGTYKVSGNTVTFTIDGDAVDATLDGDRLTVSQGGAKMVFEKEGGSNT